MEKFGKSQPIKRKEDVRFLTGAGRYIDDISPADALHTFVFRSPVAHANIYKLRCLRRKSGGGCSRCLCCWVIWRQQVLNSGCGEPL